MSEWERAAREAELLALVGVNNPPRGANAEPSRGEVEDFTQRMKMQLKDAESRIKHAERELAIAQTLQVGARAALEAVKERESSASMTMPG